MALKAIYDKAFDVEGWFGEVMVVEGWFDDELAQGAAPPAGAAIAAICGATHVASALVV